MYCGVCLKEMWDKCNVGLTCDGCTSMFNGSPLHCNHIPHRYCNAIWHGCIHKKDILLDMMGA